MEDETIERKQLKRNVKTTESQKSKIIPIEKRNQLKVKTIRVNTSESKNNWK